MPATFCRLQVYDWRLANVHDYLAPAIGAPERRSTSSSCATFYVALLRGVAFGAQYLEPVWKRLFEKPHERHLGSAARIPRVVMRYLEKAGCTAGGELEQIQVLFEHVYI